MSELHPLFVEAMEAIEKLPPGHPDFGRWMAQAMDYAPEDIRARINAKAKELGLYPETPYRDDDGEPLFTCAQLAEHFGLPLEEVESQARAFQEQGSPHFRVVDPSKLHRVQ